MSRLKTPAPPQAPPAAPPRLFCRECGVEITSLAYLGNDGLCDVCDTDPGTGPCDDCSEQPVCEELARAKPR